MEFVKRNLYSPDTLGYDSCELILRLQNEIKMVEDAYNKFWDEEYVPCDKEVESLESDYDDSKWNDELQEEYDDACDRLNELGERARSYESWLNLAEETHKLLSEAMRDMECLDVELEDLKGDYNNA